MKYRITVLALALMASAAQAEQREFCPDRPGLATPPCTLDAGSLQVETSFVDYAHSRDADTIEDTTLINDMLVRYGIADHAEIRAGWTMLGFDRSRDRATGTVDHHQGTGDLTFSIRRNFSHPDGSGPSFAVQPFVTVPTGHEPIGDGTWSAGLIAPVLFDLTKDVNLTFSPEVDAAADSDGRGRHLAYALATSLGWQVGKAIQLSAEIYAQRDRDPSGHETIASLDFSAVHPIGENSQIDLSAYTGLTHATPDIELVLGAAHRF